MPALRRACRIGPLAAAVLAAFGCTEAPGAAQPASPPTSLSLEQEAALGRSPVELKNFYRDLQKLEARQLDHVHILQLGDSHTAGDVLTGHLRELFQQRFGDAGRGLMPPGLAFEGLRQVEVKVSQTGRWQIDNSLTKPEGGPYGLTGFTARNLAAGATMAVQSTDPNGFDIAVVDYLQRPGGGTFDVLLDGKPTGRAATAAASIRPQHLIMAAPTGTTELTVVAKTPGVAITGWAIERRSRGVLYESQGVVSSTAGLFRHWSPDIVRRDIQGIQPALIVLAYGTNEGFAPEFDAQAYAATFAELLSELRRAAPQASILIIAPPDGQRVDPGCPNRRTDAMECQWSTPSALATVRMIQRNAAIANGCAYWDWSTLMAGPGGIDRWARLDPPLARQDHVHFTLDG
ncbi:MAG TPA: GDSL-type esterase/lipase family protein, partial [Stellaceae bacterium]|nr:GDSL-type esterase/lipase family protein [Stellaceae bacterium]